ncbi:MAG: Na/Pi cotransporter family protein [Pseudomonadota bacterium]
MREFSFIHFFSAICFFFFGLRLAEEGLRKALGDGLRTQIEKLTRNSFAALVVGIFLTAIFQSSTATVVMLVGMGSIGVLSVRQATPIVLGADIGTTLLVLLLAASVRLDIRTIALGALIFGFLSYFIFQRNRPKFFAQAFLGAGFLFYGLGLLTAAGEPLKESPLVRQVLSAIVSNPWVTFFFGAILTAILQKSAAVLGILMSFAVAGLLNVQEAVPFVLGVNLGSTTGPFAASLRAQADGKRIAYIHVALKVIGVLLVMPFAALVGDAIEGVFSGVSYQVAAIHIGFNVLLAVLFLPLCPLISKAAVRWIHAPEEEKEFSAKYLDVASLDSPGLAFANVFREVLRMAEIAQEMCTQVLIPFEEAGRETIERLEELDDQVDHLDREIKFYLAKVNQAQLVENQGRRQLELLTLTHDLEQIGDVINKDIMELAEKKRRKIVSFSAEGWKEIQEFHDLVVENFRLAITALASGDHDLGKKVLRHKKHLAEIEQEFAQRHLLRLSQGLKEAFETSSIHLDLLSNLRRINSIICHLAYPVIERRTAAEE